MDGRLAVTLRWIQNGGLSRGTVEALLVAAPTVVLCAMLPPVGDVPAHLYRTSLVRDGVLVWDGLWYGGHYPLASYSVLYYFPAAVLGNEPLVAGAVVASALLFSSVAEREWGRRARWPARVFAILAAAPLLTGTYPFAAGLAALLGALRALQASRAVMALALSTLTLAFSPLAFALLCLALVGLAAARPRLDRRVIETAGGLAVLGALGAALALAFPGPGGLRMPLPSLLALVSVCALGAAIAARAPAARPVAAVFAVWAAASVFAAVVATPVGTNLTRIRPFALPLVLLACILVGWRPRVLAAAALAAAFAYTAIPYGARIVDASRARSYDASLWAPALGFLARAGHSGHRVEVVPTAAHWEAYHLPRAGHALARGWYRQLDVAANALLYEDEISPAAYRAWLGRLAVRHVVLPPFPLDALGARAEATLLRSGRSGLKLVFQRAGWAIYELTDAPPLLSGPGPDATAALAHERITGSVGTSGRFRLRVPYTPYLDADSSGVCGEPAPDGMTVLNVRHPGRFVLAVRESPLGVAAAATGLSRPCGARTARAGRGASASR